ncbi:U3 small nucleolar RNA-associated protein 11 [Suhomyces tanzawaensis NRRL Y-17324]|uniref:U3 small nucleolar RNA-associated protein 11 n=1 Tax=Suhomyces tanzawaensis NRRL Y-17324 TaxID=984487 RepID=A0A1E4SEE8_9ASCO|nr:U3 small nucleolar RNA-associated protein 11 [Suhomyces tanzawaensis NRRL Y-17324]ODV77899.1 U3 small nucleolar RNA-associated protein 11 [Suhomyces tanzawaensis NRRL Y-17324]
MAKLVHNVQKKQHKERSQLTERARFGLLEKKKDYRLRAADYHKKQNALKALKLKAQAYNPDEYYHAMTKKSTDERGVLIADRGNELMSVAQVKLLKTQDVNYVRTLRLNELNKIEKLKKDLDFKAGGQHTVFVDSVLEQQNLTPEEFFNTDSSLIDRRENRLRISQLQSNEKLIKQDTLDDQNLIDDQNKEKLKQFKILQQRLKRVEELKEVEAKLELTRELMKNGNKKKVVDGNGNVQFKWKNVRKR